MFAKARASPDEVAGLLEALGTEVAAVGELGLRLQLHGLVLDLADAVPLRRGLGQHLGGVNILYIYIYSNTNCMYIQYQYKVWTYFPIQFNPLLTGTVHDMTLPPVHDRDGGVEGGWSEGGGGPED